MPGDVVSGLRVEEQVNPLLFSK